MLDSKKLWETVREYEKNMSKHEKKLIECNFTEYIKGNDVEVSSSMHLQSMYHDFETAWIMCAVWLNPPLRKEPS
jgi:hypothetical protein